MTPERLLQLQYMAANHGLTTNQVAALSKAGRSIGSQEGSCVILTVTELKELLAHYPKEVSVDEQHD